MDLSLSDYAGFLGWLGATVAVHAGLAVAIYRGQVRAGGQVHMAVMLLASLLSMRSDMSMSIPKVSLLSLSGAPEPGDAGDEDAARYDALKNLWLGCMTFSILCFALGACLKSKNIWREERERGRAIPRVPPRRGNVGRRA